MKKKMTPANIKNSEEHHSDNTIDDIYQSAFSSYGAKSADYDYVDFDVDNYAYEAY